jgi:hypothetical protein
MNYQQKIKPWAIFRILTPVNTCVARFKKRSDAEEYLKILRRLSPGIYQIVFDLGN